ncbi:MAG: tetratricopeptide repeat protein [Euryarchaeota archaeon]|nr:tetratricopeptide repeat protein [Euryarchaeota archaeon]
MLYLCPSCGAFTTEKQAKCPNCGEDLGGEPAPDDLPVFEPMPAVSDTPESIRLCVVCGAFVPDGVERCPRCNSIVSKPEEKKPATLSSEDAALLDMILEASGGQPRFVKAMKDAKKATESAGEGGLLDILAPPDETSETKADVIVEKLAKGGSRKRRKGKKGKETWKLEGTTKEGKSLLVCIECGAFLPDEASKCGVCGADVDSRTVVPLVTQEIIPPVQDGDRAGKLLRKFLGISDDATLDSAIESSEQSLLVCSFCGAFMKAGDDVCPVCNTKVSELPQIELEMLPEIESAARKGLLVCRSCGNFVRAGEKFCAKCGTEVVPQKEEVRPEGDLLAMQEKKAAETLMRALGVTGIAPPVEEDGEGGELVICPKCGAFMAAGTTKCPKCGSTDDRKEVSELISMLEGTEAESAPASAGEQECPLCGEPLPAGAANCTSCGLALGAKPETEMFYKMELESLEKDVHIAVPESRTTAEEDEDILDGMEAPPPPKREHLLEKKDDGEILLDMAIKAGSDGAAVAEVVEEIDDTLARMPDKANLKAAAVKSDEEVGLLLDDAIKFGTGEATPEEADDAAPEERKALDDITGLLVEKDEAEREIGELETPPTPSAQPEVEAEPESLEELEPGVQEIVEEVVEDIQPGIVPGDEDIEGAAPPPIEPDVEEEAEGLEGDLLGAERPMARTRGRPVLPASQFEQYRSMLTSPGERFIVLALGVTLFYIALRAAWPLQTVEREVLLIMVQGALLFWALFKARHADRSRFGPIAWAGGAIAVSGGAVGAIAAIYWASPLGGVPLGMILLAAGAALSALGTRWAGGGMRWQAAWVGGVSACTLSVLFATGNMVAGPVGLYASLGLSVGLLSAAAIIFWREMRAVTDIERHILVGDARYMRREFKDAASSYNRAIDGICRARSLPKNFDMPWYSKGAALVLMGEYDEGLKCLDMALEINPDNEITWVNKGNALVRMGRPREAIKAFERAIEINPGCEIAWNNLGNMYARQGKLVDALRNYNHAIKLNARYRDVWLNKGYVLVKMGKYDEAKRCIATGQSH